MKTNRRALRALGLSGLLVAAFLSGVSGTVRASSHSDAPLIKQDPQANLTDVYAFVGRRYDDPGQRMLNVIVQVHPFCEPGAGGLYDRFADDARYSIHLADPQTGATLTRYDFFFSRVDQGLKDPDTILSYGRGTELGAILDIGDARQNYTQTYTVQKTVGSQTQTLASGLVTAPPNAGARVTPAYNDAQGSAISGASSYAELDRYTQQAIHVVAGGEVVFAGPREDGFFADAAGVFDLLDARIIDNNGNPADGFGQDGSGIDGFKGFNVLAFALQIPVGTLPSRSFNSLFFGQQTGVGVYASVSRRAVQYRRPDGTRLSLGPWVQNNRMGNPLFNEVFVALRDKDKYNRRPPTEDANFASYAAEPEIAQLINYVYGTSIATTGRSDLVSLFLPDVLRVVTTTAPVLLPGQAGFSRLGFLGGDLTDGVSGGFPNGRRLGDDVVDIALSALASGPSYGSITLFGDNVAANDQLFHQVFPYAATPHSGIHNRKDPL